MKITHEKGNHEICAQFLTLNRGSSKFHWHERYEICQVTNNDSDFIIDSIEIHAKKGDIIAINEYDIHIFKTIYNNTTYKIIQFPPRLIINSSDSSKQLKTHITREEIDKIPGLGDKIDTLFSWMKEEFQKDNPDSNELLKLYTHTFYKLLIGNFDVSNPKLKADKKDFYRIVEYVNDHFTENINVSEISSKLFIARGKLSAIFKKYAAIPLTEYIDTIRVEHANTLLKSGIGVTNSAFESGFPSVRTFNSVYKRIMKITPTQYIKDEMH